MAELDGAPEVRVPDAFETLYRENYAAVVGLAYGLSGNRWVAEDLAQEAFLRAHRDWVRVGAMESPGGWVRRVAMNLARSRWRRLRSETRARLNLRSSIEETSPAPNPHHEAFWVEVRALPSRQAQAIALHYVEDLSVAQISKILEVTEGTVKALLHQGRDRLRRQLLAKGVVDDV